MEHYIVLSIVCSAVRTIVIFCHRVTDKADNANTKWDDCEQAQLFRELAESECQQINSHNESTKCQKSSVCKLSHREG